MLSDTSDFKHRNFFQRFACFFHPIQNMPQGTVFENIIQIQCKNEGKIALLLLVNILNMKAYFVVKGIKIRYESLL